MKKYYDEEVEVPVEETTMEETPVVEVRDNSIAEAARGLQIGHIGKEVKRLQNLLGIEESGIFDRATEKALKAAIRP